MLTNRSVVLAGVETTYGTAATLTPSANAVLTEEPVITIGGRRIQRISTTSRMGVGVPLNVGESVNIKLVTELKGSGTAGTAPTFAALLKACNMTETVASGVSVTYWPNSAAGMDDSATSCTVMVYIHNILHTVVGCRGTFSIDLTAGEYGKVTFDLTGLYSGPTSATVPETPTYATTIPPRFLLAQFAIGTLTSASAMTMSSGYSAVITSCKFDIANTVIARRDANSTTGIKEWLVADRAPKGSCDPEVVAPATFSPWSIWEASTPKAITAQAGSTAGNTCKIFVPSAYFEAPSYGDREKFLINNINFTMHPVSGNDELGLKFT